jgi:NDP-sugar pyrophosphorylase family protein
MQLVVLAAGLGTRLRPVTDDRSKAMVPVLDRPLVERAMEPWAEQGLTEAILVVGPEDAEIRSWFDSRDRPGLDIRFVEQSERRGMAHALGLAAPLLRGDFAVTACDSLVPTRHVRDLFRSHTESAGVLSLMDVGPEKVARSAAVELQDDRVLGIVEKPAPGEAPSYTVSLPHYVLPAGLLDVIPNLEPSARGEIELQDAIQRIIDRGVPFTGIRTTERRQVSSPDDLLELNLDLLRSGEQGSFVDLAGVEPDTEIRPPVRVEPGVVVGSECVVGPNVFLESGCRVGNRVRISDSVVLRSVTIPDGRVVEGEILFRDS